MWSFLSGPARVKCEQTGGQKGRQFNRESAFFISSPGDNIFIFQVLFTVSQESSFDVESIFLSASERMKKGKTRTKENEKRRKKKKMKGEENVQNTFSAEKQKLRVELC